MVTDITEAGALLCERDVTVDGSSYDDTGAFHHAGTARRRAGVHPARASYGSFAAFTDPESNAWFLQEVTQRHPGR